MNTNEAKAVLVTAFRALDDEKRARLRRHAEAGTPICCGEDAQRYTDARGGG